MFIAFEGFYSSELWTLVLKAIWELAHKWVLTPKYIRSKAQKPSKGFIFVYVRKSIPKVAMELQPHEPHMHLVVVILA